MKTWIVLTCIATSFIIFFPSVNAQLSLKAGAGMADIAFLKRGQTPYLSYEINSLWHRKPMLSFQGGISYGFELGNRLSFKPEMILVLQGLNYSTSYLYEDIVYRFNLTYLQFPLLLEYKVFLRENRYSALKAGPYAGLGIRSKKVTCVDGIRAKETLSNVKNADIGLVAGYSVNFSLPKGGLEVGFRLAYSLVNMMEPLEDGHPDYYGPSKEYARNVNVSFVFGYVFDNLKKP